MLYKCVIYVQFYILITVSNSIDVTFNYFPTEAISIAENIFKVFHNHDPI